MLFSLATVATSLLGAASAISVPRGDGYSQSAIDSGRALAELNSFAALKSAQNFKGTCTAKNVKVRREWRTLTKPQRKNYIDAVKCLRSKPSLFGDAAPGGVASIFDDFIYVHFTQTMTIHNTGNFLTWHRYFMHAYENQLKACGFTGVLPYWEWGLDVNSPRDSPVFDGSATSLGGDGEYIPGHEGLWITQAGGTEMIKFPPGTGGGCVTTGPFGNLTIRMGGYAVAVPGSTDVVYFEDPTADNTRCLKRDLNPHIAKNFTSFRNTTELILKHNEIGMFQADFEGDGRYPGTSFLGCHGGGHFTIGGDPGSDAFISPGDPAFYVHHTQVDRVFWIWQMQDFANRQKVHGTNFFLDLYPSANTTVDDVIDISPLAAPTTIKNMMNTVGGGPLCYIYA
ncbi:tyrosinase-like protein [Apodospora peruviana]|uniref:Tyrosinase-like protein n=1 Tax=Apodospora peruviana TaxID=516989 RepID=A0AAE0MA69_9PEZI|nr:tyrosinase-like protein [Apodospora peruviana]